MYQGYIMVWYKAENHIPEIWEGVFHLSEAFYGIWSLDKSTLFLKFHDDCRAAAETAIQQATSELLTLKSLN